MFQMKNLFAERDLEDRKSNDDKIDYRGKKSPRMKKKSKKSPSKILNYKQALRSRLTVKHGIFPQAIKTNILSRNDRTLHSPKIPANEEINQRLKNYNVTNKLFREEKSSNDLFQETPSRNELQESFCAADYQSHMSVNTSPLPQGSITLSDSMEYHAAPDISEILSPLSPMSATTEMDGSCMPSADFTYYAPQQAQKILLYQEVCQIVKKTMILEKVQHFGNFTDMVQEVRNKLWEVRSSRDENFNPDARSKASISDPYSDDELYIRRSPLNFDSPLQDVSKPKTPINAEMDEAWTSPPFEFRLPHEPGMRKNCGGICSVTVVDDCASMDSKDEADKLKFSVYRPKKNDHFRRKYQNSIFSSALIPTCKLDQNLTMDPLEFLENLSKTNHDSHRNNNEFDLHQSTFADSDTKLNNYRSPRRGSSTEWPTSTGVGEPFLKNNERSNFEEYCLRDYRSNRNLDISMKYPSECTKLDESIAPEMAKSREKNPEILSKSDYVFPSLVSSDTPEMKYYPCRLY